MFRLSIESGGVVAVAVSGDLTPEGSLADYQRFLDMAPSSQRVLWDLTGASLDPIPSSAMRDLAASLTRLGKGRRTRGGRAAVVCRPGVDFGLARMLVTLLSEEGSPLEFEVFHDLGEARTWLETGQTWPYRLPRAAAFGGGGPR